MQSRRPWTQQKMVLLGSRDVPKWIVVYGGTKQLHVIFDMKLFETLNYMESFFSKMLKIFETL